MTIKAPNPSRRGIVEHRVEGRQFIYRALVQEDLATRSMVAEISERLFGGDVPRLVSHLLQEHELSAGDVERIRDMIADFEADQHDRGEDDDQHDRALKAQYAALRGARRGWPRLLAFGTVGDFGARTHAF